MALSIERVLLDWVSDLELGLEELARDTRRHRQTEQFADLLQSARDLLALAQTQLSKPQESGILLFDATIASRADIHNLCADIKHAMAASAGNADVIVPAQSER